MSGAQAIAALAYGTETIPPVDVIVGPGSLWVQEAKRQVSGRVGIDGFAGPRDLTVIASAGADPAALTLDLLAQAEHGEGSLVVAVSDDAALLDALERASRWPSDRRTWTPRSRSPRRSRPSICSWPARRPRRSRRGCATPAACSSASRPAPRSATTSRVRTTRCPPTAPRASPPGSTSRHFRRRMAEVRLGAAAPALARAGVPIARAEGFERHAASMELRENPPLVTRTAQITRKTGETDVSLTLGARRHRRRHAAAPASASSTTCSTCSPATAASTSTSRSPATCRPARTTPSRTPGSCSARRSTRRSATAAGSSATATRWCRWTRRAPPARSTSPGRPYALIAGFERLPAGEIAGFEHEAAEEFFRAVAIDGAAHAAPRAAGRHERAPHDRGVLQGVRPRAAHGRRDRPERDRRARRRRGR